MMTTSMPYGTWTILNQATIEDLNYNVLLSTKKKAHQTGTVEFTTNFGLNAEGLNFQL